MGIEMKDIYERLIVEMMQNDDDGSWCRLLRAVPREPFTMLTMALHVGRALGHGTYNVSATIQELADAYINAQTLAVSTPTDGEMIGEVVE